MNNTFHLLPLSASTAAPRVDSIFQYLTVSCSILAFIVFALIIIFCWRYREGSTASRQRGPVHQRFWETLWIGIPFILTMVAFVWSAKAYYEMYIPPRDAVDIYVVGKQWMWKFYGPGDVGEINELHLPIGKPVRLLMTSEDVIHSFFVSDFRVKQDVLPSRYTSTWFTPSALGRFRILCTQYCGTSHAEMGGWITVMPPAEYKSWLESRMGKNGQNPARVEPRGESVFHRYSCNTCHQSADSTKAPTLAGVYGSKVQLADGSFITADENYIRDSILQPNSKIVMGYRPLMPSYQGQISEEELAQIISYIKSMGVTP